MEFLSTFGIISLSLAKREVYIAGDALARASSVVRDYQFHVNNTLLSEPHVKCPDNLYHKFEKDTIFQHFYKELKEEMPDDQLQKIRLKHFLSSFHMHEGLLFFNEKIWVSITSIRYDTPHSQQNK